ncbi:MAG: hypothetical protein AAEJ46_09150 [Planctomycetota bacterium]
MIPKSATTLELIIELNHYLSGVRDLVEMAAADINRCRTDRRGHQQRLLSGEGLILRRVLTSAECWAMEKVLHYVDSRLGHDPLCIAWFWPEITRKSRASIDRRQPR